MKNLLQFFLGFIGYSIIKSKNFRRINRTLDHAIKYLLNKNNPIIIDVGAHEGESILRFCKLFKNPKIHSFEPQLESFQKLEKIQQGKDNLYINNFGLGSKIENKEIYINSNTAASSYLNLNNKSKYFRSLKTVNKQNTKINTLDNYLIEKKINFIDLIKIDVQGFENDVLNGALKSLNKVHLIEIEIVFVNLYEKYNSFYQIEKILNDYNFELYSLSSITLNRKNDRIRNLDALYYNTKINKEINYE